MGGAGGMDNQRLGIADIGQVRNHLEALDEDLAAAPRPPLTPKQKMAPGPFGRYLSAPGHGTDWMPADPGS